MIRPRAPVAASRRAGRGRVGLHRGIAAVLLAAAATGLAVGPAGAADAPEYAVQPGDTLSGVAARLGVAVEALVAANALADPDALVVGLVLRLPPEADAARAAPAARGARPGPFAMPLSGPITTYFLERGPYWSRGYHTGLDIAAPVGSAIAACADGVVVEAESGGYNAGYGNYVKVDHGGGVVSLYGHMSDVLARVGDQVGAGTVLGRVGMTGNTTGPHLHWEVRRDGAPSDPLAGGPAS